MAVDPELEGRLKDDLKGEFVIEKEIGRGGMAIVYLAHDPSLGRKVAIKALPPDLTFGSGMIERFKREARTAATLDHPHIIPIHRVSTGGRLFWYVMKYVEGESLADLMEREGQLPLDRAADVLDQVAQALEYAHQHSVIHRDVKPANAMIDRSGWVTVTDFGIAKAVGTQSITGSGSMIGTPHYMSPEQCAGKKVTPASDQYSLAVVAYQMITGHVPFTGETIVDIIKKHCMDPVPPVEVLRPGVPRAVTAVLERALAKSPEERFESVKVFADAFWRAAHGEPVEVGPASGSRGAKVRRGSKTATVSPVPGALGRAPKLRPRWLAAVLGAFAGIVLLGALGVLLVLPRLAPPGSRAAPTDSARARVRSPAALPPVSVVPADTTGDTTAASAARRDTGAVATTVAPAETTTTGATPREARLTLRNVPPGAAVRLDGREVRGNSMSLEPGRRHVVTVTLSDHSPWVDTLRPGEGQRLARVVTLRPIPRETPQQPAAAQAPAQQLAPPQAAPAQPQQAPPSAPQPAAQVPPVAPQPAAPAVGYVTVGSRPLAAMTINGRPISVNPVQRYEVPAGSVRIRFVVTDSTGIWAVDTMVTVGAGEHKILGYVRLVRRP